MLQSLCSRTCGRRRIPVVLIPDWWGRAVVRISVRSAGIGRVESYRSRLAFGKVHPGREPDGLYLFHPVGHGPGRSSTVYRRRFRRGDPHFDAIVGRNATRVLDVFLLLLLLAFQYASRLVVVVIFCWRRGTLVAVVSVYLQNDVGVHVVSKPVFRKRVALLGLAVVPRNVYGSCETLQRVYAGSRGGGIMWCFNHDTFLRCQTVESLPWTIFLNRIQLRKYLIISYRIRMRTGIRNTFVTYVSRANDKYDYNAQSLYAARVWF